MDAVSKQLVSFLDGEPGKEGFCEIMRQRMTKGDSVTIDKSTLLVFFANDTLQARKLTHQQALAFRDTFVRPFTTNILKLDQESAGCMARLVVWWKEHLPDHMDPAESESMFLGDLSDVLIREAIYPHNRLSTSPSNRFWTERLRNSSPRRTRLAACCLS